jgi:hypothetical protein
VVWALDRLADNLAESEISAAVRAAPTYNTRVAAIRPKDYEWLLQQDRLLRLLKLCTRRDRKPAASQSAIDVFPSRHGCHLCSSPQL